MNGTLSTHETTEAAASAARESAPSRESPCETLLLEGELGARELAALGDELLARARRGERQLVVDLAEVSHLDYRGVRPLLVRVEALRASGADVKLSGLSPYLAAILRAAGAHDAFECYPHPADARAAFTLQRAPFV